MLGPTSMVYVTQLVRAACMMPVSASVDKLNGKVTLEGGNFRFNG